jgi:CubicO group peptidase (beta-lactamase class C family)
VPLRRSAARLLSCCAFCLAGAACSSQTIDQYLAGLEAKGAITGAVLVSKGGKVLVDKGYGFADEELRTPNTPQTMFRIGSCTKQFTSMGILLLQDEGKLDVQDSICKYVASCPAAWQPVTLHHLLIHASGISDYTNFADFPSLIGTAVTVQGLIDRFKPLPLEFTPGSRWSYSNSGYVLLGYVIEQVSGEPYGNFLAENIFVPLGMKNTGYDDSNLLPGHATGYLSPGNKPVFIDMSEVYAAGALYSNVEDLRLWDEALMAGKLVSAKGLSEMTSVQIPCPPGGCALSTDRGYGYGWFIAGLASDTYVYHWGRIDGFKASNGFFARDDVAVAVLSNLETTDPFAIAAELGTLAVESH